MAIIIPSKNIYQANNPKIKDNVINKVFVEETVVKPDNQYNFALFNEEFTDLSNLTEESKFDIKHDTALVGQAGNIQTYNLAVSYIRCIQYYKNLSIKIPVIQNNHFVKSLLLGKDDNGEPNIKVSLRGVKTTGDVKSTIEVANGYDILISSLSYENLIETPDQLFSYNSEPIEYPITSGGVAAEAKANAQVQLDLGNLSQVTQPTVSTIDGIDYYELELKILSNLEITKIGLEDVYLLHLTGTQPTYNYNSTSGNLERYVATSLEITIYGDTIGISLNDGSVYYGDGNKPYTIDRNEILQDTGKTNEKLTSKHLSDNIQTQYENGKETATILCDINDYYEYDESATNNKGEKIISVENSNRMSFRIHDIVIPMVRNEDGNDIPMSRYNNGSPKQFSVISIKKIYDGATWQRLTLQELSQ